MAYGVVARNCSPSFLLALDAANVLDQQRAASLLWSCTITAVCWSKNCVPVIGAGIGRFAPRARI
jgi:hypothetical protein